MEKNRKACREYHYRECMNMVISLVPRLPMLPISMHETCRGGPKGQHVMDMQPSTYNSTVHIIIATYGIHMVTC